MNSIEPLINRSTRSDVRCFENPKMAPALQGWKNIASFMDRGVRTVQRWQRDLALPVRHIGKGRRSAVFAFPEELQSWLRKTSDLRRCADFAVASNLLPGQETPLRIVNRLRKATVVEEGLHNPRMRKTPKGRNLPAIINFLAVGSSPQLPGDCEQCHSPLRIVEGYFWIPETERSWVLTISLCPVCDLETIGGLGAKQRTDSCGSKMYSTTPMEA